MENQKNIIAIIEKVNKDLSKQLKEVQKSIEQKIDNVYWETQVLKKVMVDASYLTHGVNRCYDFLRFREKGELSLEKNLPENIDFLVGKFKEWDYLTYHFEDNSKAFEECKDGITTVFDDRTVNAFLLMNSYSTDLEGFHKKFIKPLFNPALKVLKFSYSENHKTFNNLINPEFTFSQLERKPYKRTKNMKRKENLFDSISMLIYPEKLIYYTYMLLETIPYYDITKSGGRELKSIDKIINPRKIRLKKTIIALNSALRLINIAIAQQNLLNGDIMLPALDKALKSKPLIRDEAIKSLLNNPYLAHNFLIYKFSQNSTGNLEFKDNSVVFSKDKKLSIPSKEDIENKNYLYRPELVQLLKLREKIIHFALSNYSSYSISSDYFLYKDYN